MMKWVLLFWVVAVCVAGGAGAQVRLPLQERVAVGNRTYGTDMVVLTGEVVVTFMLDKSGKCSVVDFDTVSNNPELVKEVVWVVNHMNQTLPVRPTRAGGRSLVSVVELKVAFEEVDTPLKTRSQPDIRVPVGPIQC